MLCWVRSFVCRTVEWLRTSQSAWNVSLEWKVLLQKYHHKINIVLGEK